MLSKNQFKLPCSSVDPIRKVFAMKWPLFSFALVLSATLALLTNDANGQDDLSSTVREDDSKVSLLQIKQALDQYNSNTQESIKKLDSKISAVERDLQQYVDRKVKQGFDQLQPSLVGRSETLTLDSGSWRADSSSMQPTITIARQTNHGSIEDDFDRDLIFADQSNVQERDDGMKPRLLDEGVNGRGSASNLIGTIRVEGNITINQPSNPPPSQPIDNGDVRNFIFENGTTTGMNVGQVIQTTSSIPQTPVWSSNQFANVILPRTVSTCPRQVFAATSLSPVSGDIRDSIFADGENSRQTSPSLRHGKNDLLLFEDDNRSNFNTVRQGVYRSIERNGLFHSKRTSYRFRN